MDAKMIPSTQSTDMVTVLMSTSPVSSHPSTELIENSIRRIRMYPALRDAPVIIMVDGVWEGQRHLAPAYEEYKQRLARLCKEHPDFQGCSLLVFDEFSQQALMTQHTLSTVCTPYILFCEHDQWPEGDIPWPGFFEALKIPGVNSIRLLAGEGIHPAWVPLYADHIEYQAGVPLTRTKQPSGRPHIARTSWYLDLLSVRVGPTTRTNLESVMMFICEGSLPKHGLWVYTPPGGRASLEMSRMGYRDGRQGGLVPPHVS